MEERSRGGRVGGVGRCGSLTVGEVSFGGAWPGSRVRYDEGGHYGRFRLGRSGRVWSRRDDGRGDGPSGDGRQDAGPGFRPVDVVMVRCRVWPQSPRPGPATRGSPGPVDGRGPSENCAGRSPEPALAKAGGGRRLDRAAQCAGGPAGAVATSRRRRNRGHHLVARVRPARGAAKVEMVVDQLGQTQAPGRPEGSARHWPPGGDRRRRCGCRRVGGVVASIGCSFSGTGLLFQNHYPRCAGALSYPFNPTLSFGGFGLSPVGRQRERPDHLRRSAGALHRARPARAPHIRVHARCGWKRSGMRVEAAQNRDLSLKRAKILNENRQQVGRTEIAVILRVPIPTQSVDCLRYH